MERPAVCPVPSRVSVWPCELLSGCQAPLSMGFPNRDTGVGCHFLLQGIFPTQGSKLCLLLDGWILHHCASAEAPYNIMWRCYSKDQTAE